MEFPHAGRLAGQRIPIYCHDEHRGVLEATCPPGLFPALVGARLLRSYRDGEELLLAGALECLPLAVRHDSGATFGFRITGRTDLFGAGWSLGYVADLGCWDARLAEALTGVDLLALEFNHDVAMQRSSGRHPMLIARVLGDEGHLSNAQAADLLRQTLINNSERRLRQIVQLHLSRQCNHPRLAAYAAQTVLDELGLAIPIHTATQHNPSPAFECGGVPLASVGVALASEVGQCERSATTN